MLSLVYFCCALEFLTYGQIVFSKPTSYDQQQTGDVNVQIHLKDVQVVALLDGDLLDDYTDYDYAYDYADFTLKPISKPTTSSSTITTTVTTPSSISVEFSPAHKSKIENSTTSTNQQESTTETIDNISNNEENNTTLIKIRINDKDGNQLLANNDKDKIIEGEKQIIETTANVSNSKKSCPSRYVMDKKGRCRNIKNRRRISLVPLSMRLSPGFGENGNFNVRKDLPIRVYKSEPRQ